MLVLDTNDHQGPSQLLLVDPDASEVRGRIVAGVEAYAAQAPDGRTLYLGIGGELGLLAVDLASATLIWELPIRPLSTTVPSRHRFMEVSADGALLYVYAYSESGGGPWPAIVDAATGQVIAPADGSRACGIGVPGEDAGVGHASELPWWPA